MRRILIAEDDILIRRALEQVLGENGYEVVSCQDGMEALVLLSGFGRFDAIVSDHHMPKMTGLELLRQVERLRHRRGTRFVLTSGNLPRGVRAEAEGLDARILNKPWGTSDLLEAVSRVRGTPQSSR